MRAWQLHEFGSWRDVLALEDVPAPIVRDGDLLVRIRAAGVNFPDTLVVRGKYQVRPVLPFTPGFEAVGEIVGSGERVICWSGGTGAFGELVALPPDQIFRVPESMPDAEAATFLVSYQTSYFALVHRAGLRAGEVLLVHGAAGAIGSATIQLGKALGATVIATASTPHKEAICRDLGADHTINHTAADLAQAVHALTGRGADVVVDPIGGELFERSLKTITWGGRIVVAGFTSGVIPSIPANRILLRNISVIGVYWGDYWQHDRELIRRTQTTLDALYVQGWIRPLVGKQFAFERLHDALDSTADRANYGKNVLLVAG